MYVNNVIVRLRVEIIEPRRVSTVAHDAGQIRPVSVGGIHLKPARLLPRVRTDRDIVRVDTGECKRAV